MRILIVDDEMVSRTKMETILASMGSCQSADCGSAAIDLYQQSFDDESWYDLVMLDIDMPDMQGGEVLKQLRKIENFGAHRASVVMVTAKSDQNHVLTCLKSGCDAYIAKPFNAEIINEKLIELGFLNEDATASQGHPTGSVKMADKIFLEISDALRSGKLNLPVLPQVGIQFRDLIKNNAGLDQMATLFKQDIAISVSLIRAANSSSHSNNGSVQTLEQAIDRLGRSKTAQMVMGLCNGPSLDAENPKYWDVFKNIWQHSLASAHAAEFLSKSLSLELVIDPFCAGLFHDIGALALLNLIAQMETRGRYDNELDAAALSETIISNHAMFGAKLLEIWGFDVEYTRTTLSHNRLYTAESMTDALLVVHFANLVAKSLGYTADGQIVEIDLIQSESGRALKIEAPQIAVLASEVNEQMAPTANLVP